MGCNICSKGFKRHRNLSEHKRKAFARATHSENCLWKPANATTQGLWGCVSTGRSPLCYCCGYQRTSDQWQWRVCILATEKKQPGGVRVSVARIGIPCTLRSIATGRVFHPESWKIQVLRLHFLKPFFKSSFFFVFSYSIYFFPVFTLFNFFPVIPFSSFYVTPTNPRHDKP